MVNAQTRIKPLFDNVLEEYYRYILKFVAKQVKNVDDAKDLTQGIFLKAYSNYNKFNPKKASVKTWLFTIANNHVINFWNSAYFKRTSKFDYDFNQLKSDEDILNTIIDDENVEIILSLMKESLNKRNLEMMNLYFFSNLSPKQIADVMKMNPKTVSNVIGLSIQKIVKKLEGKLR